MNKDDNAATASACNWKQADLDHLIWVFVRGVHLADCAQVLKKTLTATNETLRGVLMGKVAFRPTWTRTAMDGTDWTEREEWILRFMREHGRASADVADLLGRGQDSIKRHWKEMRVRDDWLRDHAKQRRVELTQRDASGGAQPKQQTSFGF